MLGTLLDRDALATYAATALTVLQRDLGSMADVAAVRDVAASLQALEALGRGGAVSAAEHDAYITSNPHLSLLQALLEEAAHTGRFVRRTAPDADGATHPRVAAVDVAPEDRTSLRTSTLARIAADAVPDVGSRSAPEREAAIGQFGPNDIRWIEVVVEMVRTWTRRISYRLPADPPQPFPLAADARVVLVSDWGNGSDVATAVSAQIHAALVAAGDRECHVVHLGDIYYAGTPWESQHRFLDHWPVPLPDAAEPGPGRSWHSWVLNGNHDMYSAGEGLEVILADRRFAHQRTTSGQPTTQVQLRADQVQILGLDTSWRFDLLDVGALRGRLGPAQTTWVEQQVSAATSTVLLTHHQPFTRSDDAPAPLTPLQPLFDDTAGARAGAGLAAWFWGHDHRLLTYDAPPDVPGLTYAACLGHGAMPEPPPEPPPDDPPLTLGPGEWELTATQPPDAAGNTWRVCGFAVLDLGPDSVEVSYVDQYGTLSREPQTIPLAPATSPADVGG